MHWLDQPSTTASVALGLSDFFAGGMTTNIFCRNFVVSSSRREERTDRVEREIGKTERKGEIEYTC